MFDWLFEGRLPVYVLLAGSAVLLLVVWWQTRKRGWLIAAGAAAALVGVYALLDVAVESDREQIVRKVKEMIAVVNAHKLDAAFEYISDDFRSSGGKNKAELRNLANQYIGQRYVERVDVWDIVCVGDPSKENRTAKVSFQVKLHGGLAEGYLAECDATFAYDPQHGWRMKGVRLLKPQTTEEWNWQI